jgi:hypothetical protein
VTAVGKGRTVREWFDSAAVPRQTEVPTLNTNKRKLSTLKETFPKLSAIKVSKCRQALCRSQVNRTCSQGGSMPFGALKAGQLKVCLMGLNVSKTGVFAFPNRVLFC